MKNIFALLFILLMLVGCGTKEIECAECGQVKKGKTYTITLYGEKTNEALCDDCYNMLKPVIQALGGTIK